MDPALFFLLETKDANVLTRVFYFPRLAHCGLSCLEPLPCPHPNLF